MSVTQNAVCNCEIKSLRTYLLTYLLIYLLTYYLEESMTLYGNSSWPCHWQCGLFYS